MSAERTCRIYGREVKSIKVLWGDLKEKDYLEDLEVDGKTIIKWIFKKWYGGMDWIYMVQLYLRKSVLFCTTYIRNLRFVSAGILCFHNLVNAS